MSKYTTQLRYICESKAGLTASSDDYAAVIDASYDKIIHPDVALYDPAYAPILYKKIIKHYYFDEIAHETAARFIMRLNLKLEEILPYYNKLYESALLDFNPLYDVDYTRSGIKSDDGTNDQTRRDDLRNNAESESMDLYSDTPEGQLTGVNNETYLTNARKVNSRASGSNTGTQTNLAVIHNEGEYVEHVKGKMGSGNYADLIIKFRESILNIDMMIIRELQPLFMGIF